MHRMTFFFKMCILDDSKLRLTSKYLGTKCFIVKRVHCNAFKDFHGKFINREYHVSVFRYQVYVS